MLKRRAESKKKKVSNNNIKPQKLGLANHPEKILFKVSGGFLSPKSGTFATNTPNNSTLLAKSSKSGTVTPSSKIRKQSK